MVENGCSEAEIGTQEKGVPNKVRLGLLLPGASLKASSLQLEKESKQGLKGANCSTGLALARKLAAPSAWTWGGDRGMT